MILNCKYYLLLNNKNSGIPASGTKYWINKEYDRSKGKRVFNKVKVIYASNYFIDEDSKGIYFDSDGGYIINFS